MSNGWPVTCPHCGREFDSLDSYGDSRQMLDAHLERAHPDLPAPAPDPRYDRLLGDSR